MQITFNIDFHTRPGQQVFVVGSIPELGLWQENQAQGLLYTGNGVCELTLSIAPKKKISYTYFVKDHTTGELVYEGGKTRDLLLPVPAIKHICLKDFWKHEDGYNAIYKSSIFSQVFHQRPASESKKGGHSNLTIQLSTALLKSDEQLYISGNQPALGSWEAEKALPLNAKDFPLWQLNLEKTQLTFPFEYKYLIKDQSGNVVWETGANRVCHDYEGHLIRQDENLKIYRQWKGAGVSIPVFSLRTEQSLGVGEFLDLKPLVDWANQTGLKVIQVLPVNDTTMQHSWEDSYPYKPISVYALHPMYLNIRKLKRFTKEELNTYEQEQKRLNDLEQIDYEAVNELKRSYIQKIFSKQKSQFLKSAEFQDFFKENKHWLETYAAFCFLRDKYGTPDFLQWKKDARFSKRKLTQLVSPTNKHFPKIAIHYYIQFHLDKQLKEVVEYARSKQVALKGDIPIGIAAESADAWEAPQLFNLGTSAGAPPDDFAIRGQNWGFPTYNWEEMAKDNYRWWQLRFQKMADYFDAYRIDHILGFFRIWEIPENAVWGLLGHFNKALPFSTQELEQRGLYFDYERFCQPYIKEHILYRLFGDATSYIKETFLDEISFQNYRFKKAFDNQQKIVAYYDKKETLSESDKNEKEGLMSLHAEVLFIPDPIDTSLFHPRISLHQTLSFQDLDAYAQARIDEVYNDFFYRRHTEFWKTQALDKLPALVGATDMLVCGEDLGMVPDSVPEVMWQLKILSLEIQRMPKSTEVTFGHPADAPYLSVCTTSTHDMSTVRGWWEEDRAKTNQFYHQLLGQHGEAPLFCEPWLCENVLLQHLHSPAMLTIFPLQDLLAIDGELRWDKTHQERINIPSNSKHYWRYRMHLNLEELLKEDNFNVKLCDLIANSGRMS